MTRQVIKTNIRVIIHPRREGDYGWMSIGGIGTPVSNSQYEMAEAERIAAEVRRHVDSVSQISIAYDYETRCGTSMYLVEADGNSLDKWPECCTQDQAEFYAAHESETDEWFAEHGMDDPEYFAEFRAGEHTAAVSS